MGSGQESKRHRVASYSGSSPIRRSCLGFFASGNTFKGAFILFSFLFLFFFFFFSKARRKQRTLEHSSRSLHFGRSRIHALIPSNVSRTEPSTRTDDFTSQFKVEVQRPEIQISCTARFPERGRSETVPK